MAEESPFQHFFATLGQGSAHHADDVNAEATQRLEQALKSPVDGPGRGILLRAPRAGFGKTHLISRVQLRLSASHEFLPLTLLDGARLDATVAVESALRRLTRQLPAGGGLTALDLQARRILSLALQPLVSSGEVPCQDRESALSALRQRPVETFDFHQPQAVTAQWTKENFEVLGPRLALELSRRTGTALNETSFWLAAIFRFAVAAPDHPGRSGMIIQSATAEAGVERFAALMGLLSQIMRVVLVADDLEGLHADPGGSLRLGSFLAAVRQDAPRVDAIVSVNDDIWSSSFEPALSGGLQDRLGEIEIRLGPLDDQGIVALLNERAPGRGAELFSRLSLAPDERYSRKILRLAAAQLESLPAILPHHEPESMPLPSAIFPEHRAHEYAAEPAHTLSEQADPFIPVAEPVREETPPAPAFTPEPEPPMFAAAPPVIEEAAPVHVPEPAPPTPKPEPQPEPEAATVAVAPPPLPEPANPFSIAAEPEPEPAAKEEPAPAVVSPFSAFQPAPASTPPSFSPPPASPFTAAPVEEKPVSHAGEDDRKSASETPLPAAAGGDRIDDLLRQFRDRYGRE
ncbi:MAG: hypothetical protein JWO82_374 [Akkermansiaceae bacterium]|nr:hypothetical protein [Akkermansiaceae bacterium]